MLRHPDAPIAPFLGVGGDIASILERAAGVGVLRDANKFENGQGRHGMLGYGLSKANDRPKGQPFSGASLEVTAAAVGLDMRPLPRYRKRLARRIAAANAGLPSELPEPHDHVNGRDARAVGSRDLELRQQVLGDVGQFFRVLAIEVVVRSGLGVVPELGVVDRYLPQEA